MRLLGLDFESTGLDTAEDRIIEVGAVLWETDKAVPLITINHFVYNSSFKSISEEASKVNGITDAMLIEFGREPALVYPYLDQFCGDHKVEYLVAHNAENFDKAILMSELDRLPQHSFTPLRSLPWIDTRTDIPYEREPSSRRLNHLAADAGFINPFAHRAVFDVLTMLRVLSTCDIRKVIEYQKIPFVTVQALVGYNDRQLAKDARFSWQQIGTKTYPGKWVKRIKQSLLEQEKATYKFTIAELHE